MLWSLATVEHLISFVEQGQNQKQTDVDRISDNKERLHKAVKSF